MDYALRPNGSAVLKHESEMQATEDLPLVTSPFNLQTYQRRLRHLQSIAVRNLHCPQSQDIDLSALTVYFTLHKDEKNTAFYTSEKISGSLNPTWQSFDLQRCDSDVDLTAKFVVVRIWWGYGDKAKVKIEAHVHLSGLVFFANKLQVPGVKYQTNTLLFGMFNNIFIHYDASTDKAQLGQWMLDKEVPKGKALSAMRVDQSLVRPSYNTNYLSRIHTVQRAIKQTQASVHKIHSQIEDRLLSSNENADKLSQREALVMKLRQLRQELLWQTQQKQKDVEELEKYRGEQDARVKDLKEKRQDLQTMSKDMEEKRTMHIQSREMLVKENAQVLFRRKQIISEMVHYIYPIREDEKSNFYICNVRLPNAEDYQGQDDVRISVALGFTCHLTQMVSHFMDMPLRYPMVHKGSRSTIVDHIHSKLIEKDREFPLYGKGKEKFQYNYAVFLLNKNISQLRFYCGLGTNDLRQTLPNLKSLLEQRLGVRSSANLEQRTSANTFQSPQPTSRGGSQASRMSQAASSNTSGYARRDLVLDYDTSAQSTRSTSGNSPAHMESPVVGGNGMAIRNSQSSVGNRMSDLSLKHSEYENSDDIAQSNSGAHPNYRHSKNGYDNGGSNLPDSKQGTTSAKSKAVIKEEDEGEDLFEPSEDNFFQVKSHPEVTAFNNIFKDSMKDSDVLSSSFNRDIDSNGVIPTSDLLQDNGQTSFKLVKTSTTNPDIVTNSLESPVESIDNPDGHVTPRDPNQQLSASHKDDGDANAYTHSASYEDSEMDASQEK